MDSQGTVEVFRAVTTRERVVKNEEKILTKTMRKMYSPKERIKCAYLSAGGEYVFLVLYQLMFVISRSQSQWYVLLLLYFHACCIDSKHWWFGTCFLQFLTLDTPQAAEGINSLGPLKRSALLMPVVIILKH